MDKIKLKPGTSYRADIQETLIEIAENVGKQKCRRERKRLQKRGKILRGLKVLE